MGCRDSRRCGASQEERLDYALQTIRDHGGRISRKQLTDILSEKSKLAYCTASAFIKEQIGKTLFEVNGMIQASPELTFGF